MIDYLDGLKVLEEPEIEHHDEADEHLEDEDELALCNEVGLAGLVDEFRDLPHGSVHGKVLELPVDDQTEEQAKQAHEESRLQQRPGVDTAEADLAEVRKDETGLSSCLRR